MARQKVEATPEKRKISVVERRLKSGLVFAGHSGAIPLKDPDRWVLREVNSEVRNGRIREMQHDLGWVYLEPDDLAVEPHEVGLSVLDGRLVKGTHGSLVMMKMERPDYQAVVKAKEEKNRAHTFGQKAIKQSILSAAQTQEGGADGAEFLNRHIGNTIQVTDSTERVTLEG